MKISYLLLSIIIYTFSCNKGLCQKEQSKENVVEVLYNVRLYPLNSNYIELTLDVKKSNYRYEVVPRYLEVYFFKKELLIDSAKYSIPYISSFRESRRVYFKHKYNNTIVKPKKMTYSVHETGVMYGHPPAIVYYESKLKDTLLTKIPSIDIQLLNGDYEVTSRWDIKKGTVSINYPEATFHSFEKDGLTEVSLATLTDYYIIFHFPNNESEIELSSRYDKEGYSGTVHTNTRYIKKINNEK